MDDQRLDQFFRKRLAEHQDNEYNPAAWQALQPRLATVQATGLFAMRRWLRIAGAGIVVLLLANALLWYKLMDQQGKLEQMEHQLVQSTIVQTRVDTVYQHIPPSKQMGPHSPIVSTPPSPPPHSIPRQSKSSRAYQNIPIASSSPSSVLSKSTPPIQTPILLQDSPSNGTETIKQIPGSLPISTPSDTRTPAHSSQDLYFSRPDQLPDDSIRQGLVQAAVVDSSRQEADSVQETRIPLPPMHQASNTKRGPRLILPPLAVGAKIGLHAMRILQSEVRPRPSVDLQVRLPIRSRLQLETGIGFALLSYERKNLGLLSQEELERYPDLVQAEPSETIKEVYMEGRSLQIPLILHYQFRPEQKWGPYLQIGLISRYWLRQQFTYEVITAGGESERSPDPVRPGWQSGTLMFGSGVRLFSMGQWSSQAGIQLQADLLPQGVEQLRSFSGGLQFSMLYQLQ